MTIATGQAEAEPRAPERNSGAVELDGAKGSKARPDALTPQKPVVIAKMAAKARWDT